MGWRKIARFTWAQRERILGLISDVCHRKQVPRSYYLGSKASPGDLPWGLVSQGRIQDCGLLKRLSRWHTLVFSYHVSGYYSVQGTRSTKASQKKAPLLGRGSPRGDTSLVSSEWRGRGRKYLFLRGSCTPCWVGYMTYNSLGLAFSPQVLAPLAEP